MTCGRQSASENMILASDLAAVHCLGLSYFMYNTQYLHNTWGRVLNKQHTSHPSPWNPRDPGW